MPAPGVSVPPSWRVSAQPAKPAASINTAAAPGRTIPLRVVMSDAPNALRLRDARIRTVDPGPNVKFTILFKHATPAQEPREGEVVQKSAR
ncbi:hypothetical protein BLTE_15500 [Blastochloris tepida]|uniref:Uncharacterized protein n=1 Tax=Blastochloris tepida TaxID=2233851 RepID=A0A348FZY2_9HYPH|nr:hypothetical protein BLTE_15500 [Blastochloris tepida]